MNVGRAILLVTGEGVVLAAYVQREGSDMYATWSFTAGCLMVTLACILPWLKSAKAGPATGLAFDFQSPAELSTGAAVDPKRAAAELEVDPDTEELVEAARYLVASFAVRQLLTRDYSAVAGVEFHLYLWDAESRRLLPVFELPGSASEESEGWEIGTGATGTAFERREYVLVTGSEIWDGYGLTAAQRERYKDLAVVAAMPVLNATGRAIGVLSGSSRDPASLLAEMEGFQEHVALADGMARILVDLLKWATDSYDA